MVTLTIDPKINRVLPLPQGNHVAKFVGSLPNMIPLWKGTNPIYFGVITIILFDNLYRWAYFVMHTFLVVYRFLYY
jgi:hypothetical protein